MMFAYASWVLWGHIISIVQVAANQIASRKFYICHQYIIKYYTCSYIFL
jgi:hypothetical protein